MSTIHPEDCAPFGAGRVPLDQGGLPELASPGMPLYRDCSLPSPLDRRRSQPTAEPKLFGFRYRRQAARRDSNKVMRTADLANSATQTATVAVGFQSAGTKSFEETWRDGDMNWDEYTDD